MISLIEFKEQLILEREEAEDLGVLFSSLVDRRLGYKDNKVQIDRGGKMNEKIIYVSTPEVLNTHSAECIEPHKIYKAISTGGNVYELQGMYYFETTAPAQVLINITGCSWLRGGLWTVHEEGIYVHVQSIPERKIGLLTPYKRYKVRENSVSGVFDITSDVNTTSNIRLKVCCHLDGKDWIVEQIGENMAKEATDSKPQADLENNMKTYVYTNTVPTGRQDRFTAGKRYQVEVNRDMNGGHIVNDKGNVAYILFKRCAHLDNGNWIVERGKQVQEGIKPQCTTQAEVFEQFARVSRLIEGTDVLLHLVYEYSGPVSDSVFGSCTKPENYRFALAILNGKPVFIGDTLYDIAGYYFKALAESDFTRVTWDKPKTTFTLNGVKLPLPDDSKGCPRDSDGYYFLPRHEFIKYRWNSNADRDAVMAAIHKLLSGK